MQKTFVLLYTVELSFSPLKLRYICSLWKERTEGRYQNVSKLSTSASKLSINGSTLTIKGEFAPCGKRAGARHSYGVPAARRLRISKSLRYIQRILVHNSNFYL